MKPIESAIEHIKFAIFDRSFKTEPTDREVVKLMVELRRLCDSLGLDYYSLADRSYELYLVERDEAKRPADKH